MGNNKITNAMTVDVEDYFQVSAFEKTIAKSEWETLPQRADYNTHRFLDLFEKHNIKATFFTLGWVAERHPSLIQRIVKEGHELACHGYDHIRVTELDPEQFRNDVVKTKKMLEDIGGREVIGYRAPSYSIGASNPWAHNILAEVGFRYSSSVYPVKHDLYGMPEAPRFMYEPIEGKNFKEIPITTLPLAGKNWPCGGGGFFRFYPYFLSKWAFNVINQKEHQPGIFYCHPWEIDPEQPRQKNVSFKSKFRHYLNLDKMEGRIVNLLHDFSWDTMSNVFLNIDKGR
ncbi:Polysaccharide deacetylase domain protein [Methylotuvimicrobium alcaliphilum 20Z]|uniref:Polysaccharide deacetylase domain protein n=2 Tax=Methylotuvimicrobium alcaliphilum TaxID=271065 RepID=G4SXS2_META2|nr:Polysaccharide deacetylase domain protein [Methylotuvimicrobium alcaliphilum 20Z]